MQTVSRRAFREEMNTRGVGNPESRDREASPDWEEWGELHEAESVMRKGCPLLGHPPRE